ncbi:MAG TPA: hypothetical protein VMS65_08720, partial [Polyangiaceae bacterium]|nr:hypothetical protein [Polyangiaceae bacterium]
GAGGAGADSTANGGAGGNGGNGGAGGAGGLLFGRGGIGGGGGNAGGGAGGIAGAGMAGGGMAGGGMAGMSSGAGGMAGSGGTRTAGTCAFECASDDDCSNYTREFVCNPDTLRCEEPLAVCDDNDDCIPLTSGWNAPCESDLDCYSGFACIAVLDGGRCATLATGGTTCNRAGTELVAWPRFGAGGNAPVCQDLAGRCDRGACRASCVGASCNLNDRGGVCNATTGLCGCNTNPDCTGRVGVSICNTTAHVCECANDDDCDDFAGGDICVNGHCGCSGVGICDDLTPPNPAAEPVCD